MWEWMFGLHYRVSIAGILGWIAIGFYLHVLIARRKK
jgi:hypothetical protein